MSDNDKKRISMMLAPKLKDALRLKAEELGVGYQVLIQEMLAREMSFEDKLARGSSVERYAFVASRVRHMMEALVSEAPDLDGSQQQLARTILECYGRACDLSKALFVKESRITVGPSIPVPGEVAVGSFQGMAPTLQEVLASSHTAEVAGAASGGEPRQPSLASAA